MATVLSRFGGVDIVNELNGPAKMHRLENVMTLSAEMHTLFDTLRVWLEATVSFPSLEITT